LPVIIRDNWLSNRVFQSYDDIVDHCCFAWNRLVDPSACAIGITPMRTFWQRGIELAHAVDRCGARCRTGLDR
jgi:hypothetical protein